MRFKGWVPRVITSLLSFVAVDAFNAWKLETRQDKPLDMFTKRLCKQLLSNKWDGWNRKGGVVPGMEVEFDDKGSAKDSSDDGSLGDVDEEVEEEASESQQAADMLMQSLVGGSQSSQESDSGGASACQHPILPLSEHAFYVEKAKDRPKIVCKVCGHPEARYYCQTCSSQEAVTSSRAIYGVCGLPVPGAHRGARQCAVVHTQQQLMNT